MAIKFEELNKDGSVKRQFKGVKWIALAAAVAVLAAASFTIVPAGSTGVVLTLGKVSQNSMSEGFHLKIPFIQDVEDMSNKIQVYETPSSAVSKDLQTISSTIAVNYRLVSDKSADMYKDVGIEYQTILITPAVQECMKSVTSKYTAEELITKRQTVGDEVKDALGERLNSYGIYIEKFNIVDFDFSSEYNNAIEAKQVAEQNLLKTQTEQEQAIVIAEADAKQKVIAANAEAEAILAEAQAQADANKLIEDSLSEKVIAYEQIQKQRRAGSGYGAPRQSYYGTTSNGYSSADPTMQQIRLAIARGDISQAERLLNAVSDHNAEWSFLMGNVCYRRGWLDEAKRYFETACRMDPENPEYRQALAAFNNRGYRPQGYQTVSTSCGNDVCSNWCLAALCCNLLGGGGYFCLPCMF